MKNVMAATAALFLLVNVNAADITANRFKKESASHSPITNHLKKELRKQFREEKRNEINDLSKLHFEQDFSNAKAVWNKSPNYDEAVFMQDGNEVTAYYDGTTELVGTTMVKSFNDLPLAAKEYLEKHYSDYTKDEVIFFDDNELNETNMNLYDTPFEDEDNYFVELSKGDKKIILRVNMEGQVSFFKNIH
ncbi:MAG: hypothetical protein HY252_16275 [Sphingobacteriales bacterium]|nr:hypothetical protein [Sphingobacteriales bacterium]